MHLDDASDWRGVAARGQWVAAAVRTSMPGYASFVYYTLGSAYQSLGDYSKSIEYHAQRLAIAKEVGDRAGEGGEYGNLCRGHKYLNEYGKAIAYLEAQHDLAISLKSARMHSCSTTQRSTCVSPSPLTSEQFAWTTQRFPYG